MSSLAFQPYDYSRLFQASREDKEAFVESRRKAGFGEAFGAAVNTEWVTSWLGRQLTAASAGNQPDPNYDPTATDEWGFITDGLNPEYWPELANANSRRQALKIRDNYLDVQSSREVLAKAGASGIVATFAAAALDPAVVLASFGSGALIGAAGKTAGVGSRFIRGGLAGVAVDVPAEAYMLSQDPERGLEDVLLTGVASFGLGGLGEIAGHALANRAANRDARAIRSSIRRREALGAASEGNVDPLTAGGAVAASRVNRAPLPSEAKQSPLPDYLNNQLRSIYLKHGFNPGDVAADVAEDGSLKLSTTKAVPESVQTSAQADIDLAYKRAIEDMDIEPVEQGLVSALENEGFDEDEIAALQSDPENWQRMVGNYGNPEPPDVPATPEGILSRWEPGSTGDDPAFRSRARRSFIGWTADKRVAAPVRKLGNMLFTDAVAGAEGGVRRMAADQVARRLHEASMGELNRVVYPSFRKWQKAQGIKPWMGLNNSKWEEFGEQVIRAIELDKLPEDTGIRDIVNEAAVASRKFYSDWLDRAREVGYLDEDTFAHLKENTRYFPRSIDAKRIRRFEAEFKDGGRQAFTELVARAHASAMGDTPEAYDIGEIVIETLGWNFRGQLKNLAESERVDWVTRKFADAGMTRTGDKQADSLLDQITSLAEDPDALYNDLVAPYATAHQFARFYSATARNLGSLSDADKMRLFTGKQLESLRRVLSEEGRLLSDLSDAETAKRIDEIVRAVSESATEGEKGTPSNLRFRSAIDNYYKFNIDHLVDTGQAVRGTSISLNDFLNRNIYHVSDRYARSMSGSVAMKKVMDAMTRNVDGEEIPASVNTKQAFMQRVEAQMVAEGLDPTADKFALAVRNRFEAGVREIMGIPQEPGLLGQGLRQPLRVWRKMLNSVMTGSFGFAAIPETARILAYGGVHNLFNSMPILRAELELAKQGKIKNEILDLGDFLSGVMMSNEYNHLLSAIDPDDYVAHTGSGFWNGAERVAGKMERLGFQASGFFGIDRAGRRLAAAVAVNKYVNDFVRGRPWNPKKLAAAGLSVDDAKRIGDAISDELARSAEYDLARGAADDNAVAAAEMAERLSGRGITGNVSGFKIRPDNIIEAGDTKIRPGAIRVEKSSFGHKVAKFNVDEFEDQAAASLLTQSMSKWMSRVYQESDTGSRILAQTDPTLNLMTHFLDFVIQGWDKHTIYGLQQFKDPEVYQAFLYTSLLGSLTYIAQTYAMKNQRPEDLERAGLGSEFDLKQVFMAGIQRGGQFSVLPNMIDFVGSATGMGVLFDSRSSGLTYASEVPGLESNPSTAYLDTVRRAMSGAGKSLFHGDDFSRDDAFAIFKALPFQRHPVIHNIGQSISNLLPEEQR